jgi:hypothetical protein
MNLKRSDKTGQFKDKVVDFFINHVIGIGDKTAVDKKIEIYSTVLTYLKKKH